VEIQMGTLAVRLPSACKHCDTAHGTMTERHSDKNCIYTALKN
jgi:hypothetical protein